MKTTTPNGDQLRQHHAALPREKSRAPSGMGFGPFAQLPALAGDGDNRRVEMIDLGDVGHAVIRRAGERTISGEGGLNCDDAADVFNIDGYLHGESMGAISAARLRFFGVEVKERDQTCPECGVGMLIWRG